MRHLLAMALVLGAFSVASAQEDISSQVEEICCGASCCLIGGTCYTTGEENPSNSCQVCDPGRSQGSFTNTCDTGGGARDAGGAGGGGGGCQAAGTSGGLGLLALLGFAFIRRRQ